MIADGLVALSFDCTDHLPQILAALAARYKDRKPDLADLCLVRMSEIYPKHNVITVDAEDFRVYRRNKREIIPLISPPRGDTCEAGRSPAPRERCVLLFALRRSGNKIAPRLIPTGEQSGLQTHIAVTDSLGVRRES